MESNPWGQVFAQLTKGSAEPKPQRFNPRPPGLLHVGSASTAVLAFLQEHPGRYFTFQQLLLATGKTEKSVDYACLILRSLNLIEARRDESRNDRYFKYSIKVIQDEGDEL